MTIEFNVFKNPPSASEIEVERKRLITGKRKITRSSSSIGAVKFFLAGIVGGIAAILTHMALFTSEGVLLGLELLNQSDDLKNIILTALWISMAIIIFSPKNHKEKMDKINKELLSIEDVSAEDVSKNLARAITISKQSKSGRKYFSLLKRPITNAEYAMFRNLDVDTEWEY